MNIKSMKSRFVNSNLFETVFELDDKTIYIYLSTGIIYVSTIDWSELEQDIENGCTKLYEKYFVYDTNDLVPYYEKSEYSELVKMSLLDYLNKSF